MIYVSGISVYLLPDVVSLVSNNELFNLARSGTAPLSSCWTSISYCFPSESLAYISNLTDRPNKFPIVNYVTDFVTVRSSLFKMIFKSSSVHSKSLENTRVINVSSINVNLLMASMRSVFFSSKFNTCIHSLSFHILIISAFIILMQ